VGEGDVTAGSKERKKERGGEGGSERRERGREVGRDGGERREGRGEKDEKMLRCWL
jgi:hypothetical protein